MDTDMRPYDIDEIAMYIRGRITGAAGNPTPHIATVYDGGPPIEGWSSVYDGAFDIEVDGWQYTITVKEV